MTVLATGATGTVGREVVRGLLERGARVRAFSRHPETAGLPAAVELVRGDLTDAASLREALVGVEAVHLITFDAPRGAGGGEALGDPASIIEALRGAGVARVTVLQNGHAGPVETAIVDSGLTVTILQPVEFMANAGDWADAIRTSGQVEEPYVERLSAMVHEADIGDVAAVALTEDGHDGSYVVTGPEVLTLADKVAAIAATTGTPIELIALDEAEAVRRWREQGHDEETIGFFQWIYANTPEVGRTVADTVPRVTGRPARRFADWARDHAADFRP